MVRTLTLCPPYATLLHHRTFTAHARARVLLPRTAIAYFLLSDHSSQLRAKFVTLVDDALAGPDSTANTIEWKMQGYASAAVVLMQADRDDWFMYHGASPSSVVP